MEEDTLANAITYILLLRVKSFPKMYFTLCPPKWHRSPPLAHALLAHCVLTLEQVQLIARSSEAAEIQAKMMAGATVVDGKATLHENKAV